MSLYSAMFAGVSGLNSEASAMATVADNIANVNTVGYKSVQANFSTMVAGGRTSASYVAGGVKVAPQTLVSKAGSFQAGTYGTDMAIDGNGFFIVSPSTAANSQIAYTRAGDFTLDKNGFLKNSAGYYLQGVPLDASGEPIGGPQAYSAIQIAPGLGKPQATTMFNVGINLQSTTDVFSDADADGVTDTGAYTAGDMASGAVTPQFSQTFTVYDAQGNGGVGTADNAHQVKLSFVKTGANTWQAELYAVPATAVSGATDGLIASGEVKFNPDGTLDSSALDGPITANWTNGASPTSFTLDMGNSTQWSNESSLQSKSIDGNSASAFASVSIGDDGTVNAVYEDGTMRPVYRLALATFSNPDGLKALNGTAFQQTAESGGAMTNFAAGIGTKIAAGQLEGSTADIGKEFTNMILFQRAYSASSKIITTVDEMLQELGNMKR